MSKIVKQIPNTLTLSRLVLTVVFLVMVLYLPKYYSQGEIPFLGFGDIAFIIFVIAGLTDMVDGAVARKLGVASKFGRIMDPLADKVLICGSFFCFALVGLPKLFDFSPFANNVVNWSVAGIIIFREIYVTVLRHIAESKGINFAAVFSGKIKMLLQSFAIGTVVIKTAHVQNARWGDWFTAVVFLTTIAVTVISGIRATQRVSWKQSAKIGDK